MEVDYKTFNRSLTILRFVGLSFNKLEKSGNVFVSQHSKLGLAINVALIMGFIQFFFGLNISQDWKLSDNPQTGKIVYPLYTKIMVLQIVFFLIWGNFYGRKFADLLNHFPPILLILQTEFPFLRPRKTGEGDWISFFFLAMLALIMAFKLYVEFHISINYSKVFRVVHYLCYFYGTLFTTHFVLTMNYLRKNYANLNDAYAVLIPEYDSRSFLKFRTISKTIFERDFRNFNHLRRRTTIWMSAFMEMRHSEELVTEIFGKQVLLTLFGAFFGSIVNAYYLVTSNVYGTSSSWYNLCFVVGIFECVTIAIVNTAAAEIVANEANQINGNIFSFPIEWNRWQMYEQIKYFALFTHQHPLKFKAWVFYTISYESLFKVFFTSSAIVVVILQLEFMRNTKDGN